MSRFQRIIACLLLFLCAVAALGSSDPFRGECSRVLYLPKVKAFLSEGNLNKAVEMAGGMAEDVVAFERKVHGWSLWRRHRYLEFDSATPVYVNRIGAPPLPTVAMSHMRIVFDPWTFKDLIDKTGLDPASSVLNSDDPNPRVLYLSKEQLVRLLGDRKLGDVPTLNVHSFTRGAPATVPGPMPEGKNPPKSSFSPRHAETRDDWGRAGGFCFVAGTPVSTGDGKSKAIEKIQVGDEVVAYSEKEKKITVRRVIKLYHHTEKRPLLKLEFAGGAPIVATQEHRFFMPKTGKYVKLGVLKAGDTLLVRAEGGSLAEATVSSVTPVKDKAKVYNLEVETDHNYFVNGVLVHNGKKTM